MMIVHTVPVHPPNSAPIHAIHQDLAAFPPFGSSKRFWVKTITDSLFPVFWQPEEKRLAPSITPLPTYFQ